MRKLIVFVMMFGAVLLGSCTREVPDANENVYAFRLNVDSVEEGTDIPVHMLFNDAGLAVDNASWGNPWNKATFYGKVLDATGREIDNVLFSGPEGVIGDGSRLDIGRSRRLDIVLSHLRAGNYTLTVNMETRYTVPVWATASFTVKEKTVDPGDHGNEDVLIDDFTVPDENSGLEIDPIGNIILDLRVFNASNPFRFVSVVRPANATDKQLIAEALTPGVLSASIEGETTIVLIPLQVGQSNVKVRARKGNAERTFGVTVIETPPPTDGFTLPTDSEGGDPDADFDLGGRLMLDINDYADASGNLPGNNPYEFICRPIPSTAPDPELVASSDNEAVVKADIVNKNKLCIFPQGVGYATVTVSTTNGNIVRTLRVAVVSNVTVVMTAEEGTPSTTDEQSKIFPCTLRITSSSKYLPDRLKMHVYGKVVGRIDLTDPADYFTVESLKNSRTAIYEYERETEVLVFGPSTPSGYNVYNNLMLKMAAQYVPFHHSDDYPYYYDGVKYYRLYSLTISPSFPDTYDTNLYRITIRKDYDNQNTRIYQYLH